MEIFLSTPSPSSLVLGLSEPLCSVGLFLSFLLLYYRLILLEGNIENKTYLIINIFMIVIQYSCRRSGSLELDLPVVEWSSNSGVPPPPSSLFSPFPSLPSPPLASHLLPSLLIFSCIISQVCPPTASRCHCWVRQPRCFLHRPRGTLEGSGGG